MMAVASRSVSDVDASDAARHLAGDGNRRYLQGMMLILAACVLDCLVLMLEIATDGADWIYWSILALVQLLIGCAAWACFRMFHQGSRRLAEQLEQIQALRRAKDAAETANVTKSRYISNVSHEIRSPLNAIYGYAQLIEGNDGASAKEAVRVIRRCAEHMTSLVEGLLDVAQIEHGVLRVRSEVVRLDKFIDQLISMVRPSAAAKGLHLHYVKRGRLPEHVRTDPNRLRQVFLNLLSNAIAYTDMGSVTLSLQYSAQVATFEIRDTGRGIRPEDQPTIFDPFARGGSEHILSKPGAGLGLSISRAIVEILGGQLELVESGPTGTCLRVTLLLSEVIAKQATIDKKPQIEGYHGPRRSILIVDDDADQRQFLDGFLGGMGFDVWCAPDGESAIALALDRQFDLVLLDISLPGISGWATASELRVRGGSDLRIVMLSANAHELHRPDFPNPVHDHFLTKPVSFAALIETIGSQLELVWRFEADEPVPGKAGQGDRRGGRPDGEMEARLRRIAELLKIGHFRGLEDEIRELADQCPEAERLSAELFDRLDRFDLEGMARLVEEYEG
jgi:signal transduction histidine kinase/CheY-like chemotaxis protein